ncbi:MAG: type I DNA topoisomerase [Phycisphaerales bacterium]|jgi:DNA topoisomerase I|nr:type I DNA topoisomerase [Phycisphaerales bacterium]
MAKTGKKAASSTKPRAKRASATPSGKNLVIVESPAKAKTINRYLGGDYIVKASNGHVRDLPPKEMGVDIEHNFEPTYLPLATRGKLLSELKKYAKTAPLVFLATDLDREGEAIAWHLAEALKIPKERIRRVIFNEITATAIRDAFSQPSELDINRVNAQQARRILDRIVGYEVSPLLWKKIARGLSAGRVQTVAVRLIVERERERDAFMPDEYWRIGGVFTNNLDAAGDVASRWSALLAQRDAKGKPPTKDIQQTFLSDNSSFRAELARWKGEKFRPTDSEVSLEVVKALNLAVDEVKRTEDPDAKGPAQNRVKIVARIDGSQPPFKVSDTKQRQRKSRPSAPFTTVTMQQAASVRLHYGASRTMRIAQRLYEGLEVPGEGSVGLITYMRTDSTHLSKDALDHVRGFIGEQFGDAYLPEKPAVYSSSKRAQEAHEAIRPTDVSRTPDKLRGVLEPDQLKLYELIWRRFVACQMNPARWQVTEAIITAETPIGNADFKAMGRTLEFDGHLKVAGLPRGGDQILPELSTGREVAPLDVSPEQHFTQPPPRYTEASLVKALEAEGIGRPSTYAAIIKTIQDREYVRIMERAFQPTHLGTVVTDRLVKHLPRVFDIRFTAQLEDQLDDVETGDAEWVQILKDFYGPFHENVEKAGEEMVHVQAESEPSEYKCEKCGKQMAYRLNKSGRYLSCMGYPECKSTMPVDEDGVPARPALTDIACPACEKPLQMRKGRFGPFLSCSDYPECKSIVNLDRKGGVKLPSAPPLLIEDLKCEKCGSAMNLRRSKRGPWLSCSGFPKCRGRMGWKTLDDDVKKDLETRLMNHEKEHPQPVIKTVHATPVEAGYTPQPFDPPADSEK